MIIYKPYLFNPSTTSLLFVLCSGKSNENCIGDLIENAPGDFNEKLGDLNPEKLPELPGDQRWKNGESFIKIGDKKRGDVGA